MLTFYLGSIYIIHDNNFSDIFYNKYNDTWIKKLNLIYNQNHGRNIWHCNLYVIIFKLNTF